MDKTRIDNTMDKGRRIRQYNEQRKKDQTIQWTTEEGSDNTKDKRRRTDNTMDKGRRTDNTMDKRRRIRQYNEQNKDRQYNGQKKKDR